MGSITCFAVSITILARTIYLRFIKPIWTSCWASTIVVHECSFNAAAASSWIWAFRTIRWTRSAFWRQLKSNIASLAIRRRLCTRAALLWTNLAILWDGEITKVAGRTDFRAFCQGSWWWRRRRWGGCRWWYSYRKVSIGAITLCTIRCVTAFQTPRGTF